VSVLLGGASLVGGSALLSACANVADRRQDVRAVGEFTQEDIAFLDEVADTILPETQTPGAKAAGVGPFMALMVTDAYRDPEQRIFHRGMRTLEDASQSLYGATFLSARPDQRLELLEQVDREQMEYMAARREDEPVHYFRMMKELALLGYFTSEIGCTVAQRYRETPAGYDPCVPLLPGETSWADHA
jgi:hypothetical protein